MTDNQLFELRVIKSVCRFVAIIVSIINNIQVFFFIFAAGILAFTTAILHLLRGCPVEDCSEKTKNIKFPYDFHRAFSTTYFFMVMFSAIFLHWCKLCTDTIVCSHGSFGIGRNLGLCGRRPGEWRVEIPRHDDSLFLLHKHPASQRSHW